MASSLLPEGWMFVTKDHKDYVAIMSIGPRIVVEVYCKDGYKDGYVPNSNERADRHHPARLQELKKIFFMEPNQCQQYWTDKLHARFHVQLLPSDCEIFKSKIDLENRRRSRLGQPQVDVEVAKTEAKQFFDSDLNVRNELDPNFIFSHMRDLSGLILQLSSENFKKSSDRNQRRMDLGACSCRNSFYCPKSGLPKPQRFKESKLDSGKRLMADWWKAMEKASPRQCHQVYNDPRRQKEFADFYTPDGEPGRIEALALTVTKTHRWSEEDNCWIGLPDELFNGHVDQNNDKTNPEYSAVGCLSVYVMNPSKSHVYRVAGICYGKQFCHDYLEKVDKYSPFLDLAVSVYNKLPLQEKVVTQDLLPGPEEYNGKFLAHPHIHKQVYYSSFVHAIRDFLLAHPVMLTNAWYAITLVYACQISESPQYYWYELQNVASDPKILGGDFEQMEPFRFGYKLYDHMFRVSAKNTHPKKKIPCRIWNGEEYVEYKVKQRHQPTNNSMPSQQQWLNSVKAIGRAIAELHYLDKAKLDFDKRQYFHVVLDYFCTKSPNEDPNRKCNDVADFILEAAKPVWGVFGWGPLTGQHGIMILSLLHLMPIGFVKVAELAASTATWEYLKEEQGMSDATLGEDSIKILEGLKHRLGLPLPAGEELTCRTSQVARNTDGRYSDWIPPGCSLCFLESNEKQAADNLVQLNPDGSITEVPDVGIDLRPVLEVCRKNSLLDSKYWAYYLYKYSQPRKKVKGGKKQKSLPQLFSGVNVLPYVHPQKVILSVMPEHLITLEHPVVAVTAALSTSRSKFKKKEEIMVWNKIHVTFSHDGKLESIIEESRPENRFLGLNIPRDAKKFGNKRQRLSKKQKRSLRQGEGTVEASSFAVEAASPCYYDYNYSYKTPRKRTHREPSERIAKQSGLTKFEFYSHGIKAGGSRVLYPPHDFPLRGDGLKEQDCVESVESLEYQGRRYFRETSDSKLFTCLYAILTCPSDYVPKGRLARALMTPPTDSNTICHPIINAFKVIPRPYNQSRLPFLVSYTSKNGGFAMYRVNDTGNPVSEVFVMDPFSSGVKKVESTRVLMQYIGVKKHSGSGSRTVVQVVWSDGSESEELLSEFTSSGTHWHTYKYALEKDLLQIAGWKHFKRWRAHHLGTNTVKGNNYFDSLVACKQEELKVRAIHFKTRAMSVIATRKESPLQGLRPMFAMIEGQLARRSELYIRKLISTARRKLEEAYQKAVKFKNIMIELILLRQENPLEGLYSRPVANISLWLREVRLCTNLLRVPAFDRWGPYIDARVKLYNCLQQTRSPARLFGIQEVLRQNRFLDARRKLNSLFRPR